MFLSFLVFFSSGVRTGQLSACPGARADPQVLQLAAAVHYPAGGKALHVPWIEGVRRIFQGFALDMASGWLPAVPFAF